MYSEIGTAKSAGTKVLRLQERSIMRVNWSGDGYHLREIVYDIGGGIQVVGNSRLRKQAARQADVFLPRTSMWKWIMRHWWNLGSIMGSAGLIIMDEQSDMVDVARFFMEFCMDESCGKCVPCRVGTQDDAYMLEKIYQGKATHSTLTGWKELAVYVRESSLCGLAPLPPNPFMSTCGISGKSMHPKFNRKYNY